MSDEIYAAYRAPIALNYKRRLCQNRTLVNERVIRVRPQNPWLYTPPHTYRYRRVTAPDGAPQRRPHGTEVRDWAMVYTIAARRKGRSAR